MDSSIDDECFWVYDDPKVSAVQGFLLAEVSSGGDAPDITIRVEDELYNAYKVLMVSVSGYFQKELFSDNLKEITIHQVKNAIFSEIFKFMHTGKITVSYETLQPIFEACIFLRLPESFKMFLEDIYLGNLNEYNCTEMMEFAGAYGCSRLLENAKNLLEHTEPRIHSNAVISLYHKNPIYKSNCNKISTAADRVWINYSPRTQQSIPRYVESLICNIKDVVDLDKFCDNINVSAFNYKSTNCMLTTEIPTLPNIISLGFDVAGEHPYGITHRQELCYQNNTICYQRLRNIPNVGKRFACTVSGGKVLISGGELRPFNVYKWNIEKRRWSSLVPLCCGRCGHAMAEVNGKLYVFGGYLCEKILTSIEVFDKEVHRWKFVAHLKKPTHSSAIVVQGGRAYIFGGKCSSRTDYMIIQCFDPITKRVVDWDSIPCSISQVRVVLSRNDVYLMSEHGEFLRYTIAAKQCIRLAYLRNPRRYFGMAADAHHVFVFGGKSKQGSFCSDIHVYDIDKNSWSTGERFPSQMSVFGYCPLSTRNVKRSALKYYSS